MDEKYFPQKIEEKWQRRWEETRAFEAERDPAREKRPYCSGAPPCPSPGFLHVGHVRNHLIGDALSWFKRLQGYNVLQAIGRDGFGRPAEQAANERRVTPRGSAEACIERGSVVAETFYREGDEAGRKDYFNPSDVDVVRDARGGVASATLISDGRPVNVGPFEKVSESVNNGVDPDEMITAYGADATRLFLLFAAPIGNDLRWQEAGVEGALRFLRRVYTLAYRLRAAVEGAPKDKESAGEFSAEARALRHETHRTIERVTNDFEGLRYNTSVAALMGLSNALGDFEVSPESASPSDSFAAREALEALVLMLAPFAPHFSEEMWEALGHEGGLLGGGARWPSFDGATARRDEVEIAVQVNGKLRGRVSVAASASEDETRAAALADGRVRARTEGKRILKTVVVPGRLVNVVVR